MRACCLLRERPVYRRDRFLAGLRAAGYAVREHIGDPGPADVLVIWNRYGHYDIEAQRFERAGAAVLVAENAYLSGAIAGKWHALARSYHNDATVVRDDGPERWDALGVELKGWRGEGAHLLVCPNRSFGTPGRIMPQGWGDDVCRRLEKLTRREIRLRPHPGNQPPSKPLADDLAGAWAVVIWSSSAGVHALAAGIPVFQEAPAWICDAAARPGIGMIEEPLLDDARRLRAMRRLACAISSVDEIESGTAFRRLLQ